ncbi:MAG: ankyrin repeat domain-containing protein, partial [Syntrophales bacterium]
MALFFIPVASQADPDMDQQFITAVYAGDAARALQLLAQGVKVDARRSDGQTALIIASLNGHKDVLKILVDKGADINAKDNMGQTVLMVATQRGQNDVVKLLIAQGADVNAKKSDGISALMVAADNDHPDEARILLDH